MKKLQKGFTLIELMIVVAIIAILAAVAAPKFGEQILKSKDAKGLAVIGTIRSASTVYYADNDGVAAPDIATVVPNIDDASQKLVTTSGPGVSGGADITVGLNKLAASEKEVVTINPPLAVDGTVYITTTATINGKDTKKKDWSNY